MPLVKRDCTAFAKSGRVTKEVATRRTDAAFSAFFRMLHNILKYNHTAWVAGRTSSLQLSPPLNVRKHLASLPQDAGIDVDIHFVDELRVHECRCKGRTTVGKNILA
jgi:hypothetical protein